MVALVLLGTIVGAGGASPPAVTFVDGTVSARFEGIPLDEAIAALARETGVEFRGALLDVRDVHARFERARFRDVVDRLVGEQNFTIVYHADGRPRRVDLLGMPQPPAAPQSSSETFASLASRYGPVSLPPALVTALGMKRGRLPAVLRRGLRHGDPAVGTAAVSLFVQTVDADPALHRAFLRADELWLASTLATWSGTGMDRLIAALAQEPRDPLVRSKARRLQEQLRANPMPGTTAPAT